MASCPHRWFLLIWFVGSLCALIYVIRGSTWHTLFDDPSKFDPSLPSIPLKDRVFRLNSERVRLLVDLLRVYTDLLHSKNLTYWLDAGTLLASWREGAIFPWDYDLDIAITDETFAGLQAIDVRTWPSRYRLFVHGGTALTKIELNALLVARFYDTATGLYIDNFLIKTLEEPNYGTVWSHSGLANCANGHFSSKKMLNGKLAFQLIFHKDILFPLRPCTLSGISTFCPRRPLDYLLYCYSEPAKRPWLHPHESWWLLLTISSLLASLCCARRHCQTGSRTRRDL